MQLVKLAEAATRPTSLCVAWRPFGLSLHELPFRLDPIRVLAVHRPQADPGTLWLLDRVKRALDHGH